MYSVRGNVLYMPSFEKFVEENPAGDDNDDDGESVKNVRMINQINKH